jgi:AbiV family abortive infection protein
MPHSEQALRSAAVACFDNAIELHRSAELLHQARQLEHALALACVGVEEFGKAFLYTLAALRPDQRDKITDKIGGHHTKRWVFTQVLKNVDELRRTTPGFTIVDCFVSLAKVEFDALFLSNRDARHQYAELNNGALFPAELKDAALYVDLLADGTLRVPRKAAKVWVFGDVHVKLLSVYLQRFADLRAFLTDEGAWDAFANDVRQRVIPRPRP